MNHDSSSAPFLRRSDLAQAQPTWFERQVLRCLLLAGWEDLRHVGASWDGGADILGVFKGERWLVQVKAIRGLGPASAIKELEKAASLYRVQKGIAVSKYGWNEAAIRKARNYGDNMQLINGQQLISALESYPLFLSQSRKLFAFQEEAVTELQLVKRNGASTALVAMATGLGKTVVAGEFIAREIQDHPLSRVLVLAHSEDILKQSEKSFWRHLPKTISTHQINAREKPHRTDGVTFATFQTMTNLLKQDSSSTTFDVVVVDECHHAAATSYSEVLRSLQADFLVGLTATPWRADERSLRQLFGDPVFTKSIVEAMNQGWLSEIDYRMLADNIPWDNLPQLTGMPLTIKQLNSRLFLPQLEEAVVNKIRDHWGQLGHPRALVFCRTIDSATRICRLINQSGFARSEVISSRQKPGERRIDREIKLMRFQDGDIDILCGVDVFNEGIDVPDVNLLVFMRVTHSRRIFVQQLGRGLRWKSGKVVRVLDFVSDIRRIAALLTMEKEHQGWRSRRPVEVHLPETIVRFDNDRAASFFREWLRDIAELEDAGEESVLAFPPELGESI